MPNRGAGGVSYRYGFNGKETENDVKGIGNEQDYGMRIYDPRLGRFLSVDPIAKSFPWYTPYQFAGNNPISCIDLDGAEPTWYMIELIHLIETRTRKENIKQYSNSNSIYFAYGFVHGLAASVDIEGMTEDAVNIFRRANTELNSIKFFTFCLTGDCAPVQVSLIMSSSDYLMVKAIDEKLEKAIAGDAYDRGEALAEVLLLALPLIEENRVALEAGKGFKNAEMSLALIIENAGIAAEETKLSESYLLKALRMENYKNGDVIPKAFKKSWVSGEYKYEVRIHPGEKSHTDAEAIYRVSRRKIVDKADKKSQGTGLEYLDSKGNWHRERDLKPGGKRGEQKNPSYKEQAAKDTHIKRPNKIE